MSESRALANMPLRCVAAITSFLSTILAFLIDISVAAAAAVAVAAAAAAAAAADTVVTDKADYEGDY